MNSARRTICLTLVLVGLICSCTPKGWSEWEKTVITQSDSVMYVCVMPQDSAILRATSTNLGPEELKSAELKTLLDKMYRTLTDPSQDGVGIAAPQIGINRRMVLVMRYDKPGQPIEPYLNIQIDSLLGEKEPGPEGCLSGPPYRGIVRRYPRIQISYVKPDGTKLHDFPSSLEELAECAPIYEEFPGFDDDISQCRKFEELPETCRKYIERLEELCECRVCMVGVGPDREQQIERH